MVEVVHYRPIRVTAPVRNPGSAGCAQNGVESGRHPASRLYAVDAATVAVAVYVRLTVRDGDELHIADVGLNQLLQIGFGPRHVAGAVPPGIEQGRFMRRGISGGSG